MAIFTGPDGKAHFFNSHNRDRTGGAERQSGMLRRGMQSDDVRELQTMLRDIGYDLGVYGEAKDGIDGHFGGKTEEAVRRFQQQFGLDPDGIAGIKTLMALKAARDAGDVRHELEQNKHHHQNERQHNVDKPLPRPGRQEDTPEPTNVQPSENYVTVPMRSDEADVQRNKDGLKAVDDKKGSLCGRFDPAINKWVIQYTMDSARGNSSDQSAYKERNASTLNDEQKAMVRDGMAEIESVANIKFVEVPHGKAGGVDLTVRMSDMNGAGAYATLERKANISFDRSNFDVNMHTGGYAKGTVIHELGHILGIKHPQDKAYGHENNRLTEAATGPEVSSHNNDLTQMAYTSGSFTSFSGRDGRKPDSLQPGDVLALQMRYGVNSGHNAGNTRYAPDGTTLVRTLTDGGGFDALDASRVRGNHTLDLREGPGRTSTIGDTTLLVGNGANIEKAKGGDGNDVLYSGAREHWLEGGKGSDIFLISKPGSVTHINDYSSDLARNDADRLGFAYAKGPIHVYSTPEGAYARATHANGSPMEAIITFKDRADSSYNMLMLAQQISESHPDHKIVKHTEPRSLDDCRKDILMENVRGDFAEMRGKISVENSNLREVTQEQPANELVVPSCLRQPGASRDGAGRRDATTINR